MRPRSTLKHRRTLLKLCGENVLEGDMFEKTLSTFHASNLVLQQQYRERQFKTYGELVSCLLVAEQNNQVLLMNHGKRPAGAASAPEANLVQKDKERGNKRQRPVETGGKDENRSRKQSGKQQRNNGADAEQVCFSCGTRGHWSRTCQTPKHLVELYKASLGQKEKSGKGQKPAAESHAVEAAPKKESTESNMMELDSELRSFELTSDLDD